MISFRKKDVIEAFDRAASTYDSAAILFREVADRLFECLEVIPLQPRIILDLGAGTGYSTELLKKNYPRTDVIAVDVAYQMLQQNKWRMRSSRSVHYICADAEQLPIADNSIDFVFSNIMLPWCNDVGHVFSEVQRILKPGGLWFFSTLGPDTLQQVRSSWATVDDAPHVHLFFDLHEIGDALMRAKFSDPVMDMELLTITYSEIGQIFRDLRLSGAHNILQERRKTLTGKDRFHQFVEHYETHRNIEGKLPLTYEIIYGHAWKSQAKGPDEVAVPVSSIRRKWW